MIELLNNFHFIRPWWLLAILPAIVMAFALYRQHKNTTGFDSMISADLLPYLTLGKTRSQSKRPIITLLFAWLLAAIVLAGPTWERLPQPLYQSSSALIIALDLSPSMRAEDNKPSRIRRAQLKIQELLSRRQEGLTALIVYAGEAHIVTPFTDDIRTITNLLPSLTPGLLPIPGSNVEMAVQFAVEQLDNNGINKASLLLVTDGIDPQAIETIQKTLDSRLSLTILGLGTDAGSTIPTKDGYLKDKQGGYIMAARNSDELSTLAANTRGFYLPIQASNDDIDFIETVIDRDFVSSQNKEENEEDSLSQQTMDQWSEFGPTLLLLALPLLAFSFRRGWLLSLVLSHSLLVGLSLTPQNSHASLWDDLWKTDDQQAYDAWQAQQYDKAAGQFDNPQWQGSAHYKNKDYESALESFRQDNSASGYYNRGNSLANLGQYEEAIKAYEQALQSQPNFKEAQENKAIVEEQLQKQESQENEQSSENEDSSEKSDQDSDSKNSDNRDSENQQSSDSKEQQGEQETKQEQTDSQEENSENELTEQELAKLAEEKAEQQAQQEQALQEKLADSLSEEEQQAMQQWLRKIPDDPSGLLRRKFEYEFNKRRQQYQQGQWQLPENNAHQRY